MTGLIIRNGHIVDGAGNPWFKADLEIKDENISRIGKVSASKGKSIDASGLFVAPGFIDIHSHSELQLLVNPRAESKVRQGITTEVFPNCGSGPAPLKGAAVEMIKDDAKQLGLKLDWKTMGQYMKKLERQGISLNVALLIPHGTLRACIMGFDNRKPTEKEMSEMKKLVEQCMVEGAFGMCTGLRYVPGSYADTGEVVDLLTVVGRYGGFYASHVRDEGDRGTYPAAIAEAVEIGEKAGVSVQISHLKALGRRAWGKVKDALKIIEDARTRGVDVTCDMYPYTASGTGFMAWIPKWSHEGGFDKFLERIKDSQQRRRIIEETQAVLHDRGGPERAVLTRFFPNPGYEGKTLQEISTMRSKDPVEAMLDLIVEARGETPVVNFNMLDEDVDSVMRHPAVMFGTDGYSLAPYGILGKGKPHPRSYGTYPRVLAKYVRESRLLTIENAIRKMTSLPAQKLGLQDRGLIKEGMYADIVVFDPEKVTDKATFADPHQYAEGIQYVIVNGKTVVEKGKHTGSLSGRVLRKMAMRTKAAR
jgi:N-acyl-D-amino-acid deacylase